MHGRKVWAAIGAILLLAVVAGAAVAQSFSQVVNLAKGQTAYVSCDGAARLRADRQSEPQRGSEAGEQRLCCSARCCFLGHGAIV